ncbi:MAG: DUF4386 domain-containing protein [Pseudosphingobacterium sp.]|nr:DUF4386 domain-containing protein [Pseudosphingobacterium sp.]
MNAILKSTSKMKPARAAGLLYLLIVILGIFGEVFIRGRLVDYGDATATSTNLLASEGWYRVGFFSELLMLVCDMGVAALLFIIFRDRYRNLSLFSTFFRLACIITLSVFALSHYASLYFIGGADYLSVFEKGQLDSLALLSIKLHGAGYNISLVFFGIHLMLLGYMIFTSHVLPRISGILLFLAGICYEINSISSFLLPGLATSLFPLILVPCFIGELLFSILLLVKGMDHENIRAR